MLRSIVLFAALFFTVLVAGGATPTQTVGPEVIVDKFVRAWNSHDVKAFDRLFSNDAIWVPVAEARVVGHGDVIKDFGEIHTTWAKTTTISASDVKVQRVRPDVAVILFHAKFLEGGKEIPGIDRAMIIVAVKERDGWRISAGQLTKQHEGE